MGKEDVVYIQNGILLSLKMNEILPFVTTGMDLQGTTLSQIREREILYDFTYMWSRNNK